MEFFIKKAKGDKQKAINMLEEARREIDAISAFGNRIVESIEDQIAKGTLQGKELERARQIRHMYVSPFQLASMTLLRCIKKLSK